MRRRLPEAGRTERPTAVTSRRLSLHARRRSPLRRIVAAVALVLLLLPTGLAGSELWCPPELAGVSEPLPTDHSAAAVGPEHLDTRRIHARAGERESDGHTAVGALADARTHDRTPTHDDEGHHDAPCPMMALCTMAPVVADDGTPAGAVSMARSAHLPGALHAPPTDLVPPPPRG